MRLKHIAADTALELVVIRPPLLIGPGSKANVARLIQLVRSGLPLLAADADVSGWLARLFHFPALLELAASPLVLRGVVTRLTRSQQLNHSTTIELAAWAPKLTTRGTLTGAVTQT